MIHERPALERRVLLALDAVPPRIPVIVGGCGSGRTSLLQRLAGLLGEGRGHYVDAERVASTPERFFAALTGDTAAEDGETEAPPSAEPSRAAFDRWLARVARRGSEGRDGSVLLLDELLELRTLESFPGLRGVLREFLDALAGSGRRFVLASRYVRRTERLLADLPGRFELLRLPPLTPGEVDGALRRVAVGRNETERTELAGIVHALGAGRPGYVAALAAGLAATDGAGAGDPVGTLAAGMAPGESLHALCRFSHELRLHRARGYGALKGILAVLADEEPLTLTEVAQRLGRTPGSTRDYLAWLENVDLVEADRKRYRYADPVLRLWVRLHCRPAPPDAVDLAREAQEYAARRLAEAEAPPSEAPVPEFAADAPALAAEKPATAADEPAPTAEEASATTDAPAPEAEAPDPEPEAPPAPAVRAPSRRSWGLIEID